MEAVPKITAVSCPIINIVAYLNLTHQYIISGTANLSNQSNAHNAAPATVLMAG